MAGGDLGAGFKGWPSGCSSPSLPTGSSLVRMQPGGTKGILRIEPGAKSEYPVLIGHKLRDCQGKHLVKMMVWSRAHQGHAN